ncbi:MAG: DegV family protein [Ruminococcus sp.]|nr:DegV family protein [Ruminococcus sp.]
MSKIKLVTDSASDIDEKTEKELDIMIVPFKVTIGDKSYLSRVDFTNEQFYKMMEEYDGMPTHSQITAFEFTEIFEQLFAQGYSDVINVSINKEGSATHSNAVMAAKQFFDEHPDRVKSFHIYNIDGIGYTGAYGYPVTQGAIKAAKGESAKEIVEYIEDWVKNCTTFFAPYSLKYAKKSGRIPSAAAFAGELMGLRPIMRIQDNKIVTNSKVRGDKSIIPEIVSLTANEIIPHTPYSLVYGCDSSVRDEMAAAMTKKMGYPPVEMYQIGAAIAINAGPKVVGTIFKRKG